MFCRGHNEIDDPSFTQPMMYQVIENRASVPDNYADSLVTSGVVTQDELTKDTADYSTFLNEELKVSDNTAPHMTHLEGHWKGLVQASEDRITTWDTGMYRNTTLVLCRHGNRVPTHTLCCKIVKKRGKKDRAFLQIVKYRGSLFANFLSLVVSDY